jgi:hypothetical protein
MGSAPNSCEEKGQELEVENHFIKKKKKKILKKTFKNPRPIKIQPISSVIKKMFQSPLPIKIEPFSSAIISKFATNKN